MTRRLTRRPGTSLVEVLVGLFILSIGAIGAFVLFPLSAINVSRALVDDRTTTCAITADGQIREIHRRSVVEKVIEKGETSSEIEEYHKAMDTGASGLTITINDSGPSHPVFVDPMGVAATAGSTVGGSSTSVPRVNFNFIGNDKKLAQRFCSQMDGLAYFEDGQVDSSNLSAMREMRYNWLWVLQRPSNKDRFTVRQQVVVFDRRVHLYVPPGSEDVHHPTDNFTPGATSITGVPNTAEIRKGTWVMDATIDNARGVRNAEFYRVLSVTENSSGKYDLELHKPIVRSDGSLTPYPGTLVVMPAVAEVFDRPMLTDNNR